MKPKLIGRWVAVALIAWMALWLTVFVVNRRTFLEAEADFWSTYVEGEWTAAMVAANQKQVEAYEWMNAAFLLGLVVPIAALILSATIRVVSKRVRQNRGS